MAMACQPGCSCAPIPLRKRRSSALGVGDMDDMGVPKLKRMRSSVRIAAQLAANLDILVPSLSADKPASDVKNKKRKHENEHDGEELPPAKRRKLSSDDAEPVSAGQAEQSVPGDIEVASTSTAVAQAAPMEVDPAQETAVPSTSSVPNEDIPAADEATKAEERMEEGAVGAEEGAVGGKVAVEAAGAAPVVLDEQFESDWELICEVHPDCDPVYIREQLILLINDPLRVSTVTFDIYANENHPKRADREEQERLAKEKQELMDMSLDMETFLKKYPDPEATFNIREGDVTVLYYDHAEAFLKNEFPWLQVNYIKTSLRKAGFHMTPSYLELKDLHDVHATSAPKRKPSKRSKSRFRLYPRSGEYEYPEDHDEDFYWERLYLLNINNINEHIRAEKAARVERYEAAKAAGKLHDCPICLQTEVIEEDMVSCSSGHFFCLECVRSYSQERVSQGRSTYPCLHDTCPHHYTLVTLEQALPADQYSLALRTIQIAELREAAIECLETCPFCPYAVIVPYDSTAVLFHCENPDCYKDSCRKCRQQAHVPFSCDEFRVMKDITMRTFVENNMAESMIRTCPKCNLRFFKEEGCNHMQCSSCGTSICYVCREVIFGYQHFRKNKRCSQYVDSAQLHRQEITDAYTASGDKFISEHPEFAGHDLNMGYNPMEVLAI